MIRCEFENGNIAKPGLRHVCVGVLLIDGEKILLAKRAKHLSEGGKWCLLGGYLDRDETMLEGARRELMEESGWKAKDLMMLGINDNPDRSREDRQNIDVIYYGEADSQVGDYDAETAELKWFDLDDLPSDEEMAFDHMDSIKLYKKLQAQPFSLPVLYNK